MTLTSTLVNFFNCKTSAVFVQGTGVLSIVLTLPLFISIVHVG